MERIPNKPLGNLQGAARHEPTVSPAPSRESEGVGLTMGLGVGDVAVKRSGLTAADKLYIRESIDWRTKGHQCGNPPDPECLAAGWWMELLHKKFRYSRAATFMFHFAMRQLQMLAASNTAIKDRYFEQGNQA